MTWPHGATNSEYRYLHIGTTHISPRWYSYTLLTCIILWDIWSLIVSIRNMRGNGRSFARTYMNIRKIYWPSERWRVERWFTHDSRVFMVVLVFYWSFNKLDLACQYVYVVVVGTTTSLKACARVCVSMYNIIRVYTFLVDIALRREYINLTKTGNSTGVK